MITSKFYIDASHYFVTYKNYDKLDKEEKMYYILASVLFSWISLESHVNALSESLSKGTRINEYHKAFLQEKELRVDDEGKFRENTIRPSASKKILFILQNFSNKDVKKFKQEKLWKDIKNFENLRNRIVHHKEINKIEITPEKARACRNIVRKMKDYLNQTL